MTVWKALAIGVGLVGGIVALLFAIHLIALSERWWHRAIGLVLLIWLIAGVAYVAGGSPG